MSLSPIPRVLSTLRGHGVRALLMGGQACILYGAAEFSRDIDIAVAIDPKNLLRLRSALAELERMRLGRPRRGADRVRARRTRRD